MIGKWVVTGFGSGLSPIASGTTGSAAACVVAAAVWLAMAAAGGEPVGTLPLAITWLVLMLLSSWACVHWGRWASEHYGEKARKKGDPGQVVIDEWAGQFVALLAIPMAGMKTAVAVLAVQFFLFRLFDVIKPPPGRRLEKLPFGWGILLDDIAAGVYANIIGQVIFRVIWAQAV